MIDALLGETTCPRTRATRCSSGWSKFRHALGGLGAAYLVRRKRVGYRLSAGPDDVDVHRFARLIETARRRGEAPTAIDVYEEALNLWRGEPLVGFAGEQPLTTVEAARLTEFRLAHRRRTCRADAHTRPVRTGRCGPRARDRDSSRTLWTSIARSGSPTKRLPLPTECWLGRRTSASFRLPSISSACRNACRPLR